MGTFFTVLVEINLSDNNKRVREYYRVINSTVLYASSAEKEELITINYIIYAYTLRIYFGISTLNKRIVRNTEARTNPNLIFLSYHIVDPMINE